LVAQVIFSCVKEESTRTCPKANSYDNTIERTLSIWFLCHKK
jgi:hypothetical protein